MPVSEIDLQTEFPHEDGLIHLNHAGVGPWPRRAAEAACRFAEENTRQGSMAYPEWLKVEATLRERLRALLNAPSTDDIALLKNTSEALSMVAYGLDWKRGDNVVIAAQEFPSNRVVWESLAPKYGVEVRKADLFAGADPEASLIAACDARTRLLSVSAVQYASGLRMDLERLGGYCRTNGILFCVDAIQQLGALPFDVQAIGADFVMADGHKWMLGPEGVAVFYCRAQLRETLSLTQYGWHMVQDQGDYERQDWIPATTARRFECGSPNFLGIHTLEASLSLLQDMGIELVSRNIINNVSYIIEYIGNSGRLELLSSAEMKRRSGIVVFRRPGIDSAELYRHLMRSKVLCALRGGGIRFAPHCYTTRENLDGALSRVLAF